MFWTKPRLGPAGLPTVQADVYQSGEEHENFILRGSVIQTQQRILR